MFETNSFILAVSALLPAVVLLIYIYKKDRSEKEPMLLLLTLFILGAVISYPVVFAENIVSGIVEGAMSNQLVYNILGSVTGYTSFSAAVTYKFLTAFAVAGLVEEGFKFIVLYVVTHKNRNFNSLFDGIIYSVFVSLGFAAFENLLYVFDGGIQTAAIRAVTSIPGHMFFGVIMGYNYTLWHIYIASHHLEKRLNTEGIISSGTSRFDRTASAYLRKALIMAVIAHGIYDFTCFMSTLEGYTAISDFCFYLFLISLYVFCFRKIKSISNEDTRDFMLSIALILKSHPELRVYLSDNLKFNSYYLQKRNAADYGIYDKENSGQTPSDGSESSF